MGTIARRQTRRAMILFGLKLNAIQAIQQVFLRYPALTRAVLYGSRAKGNYRTGSDIDLVLEGENLDLGTLQKIENEIDDLMLPYKMDVSLLKHIQLLRIKGFGLAIPQIH